MVLGEAGNMNCLDASLVETLQEFYRAAALQKRLLMAARADVCVSLSVLFLRSY